MSNFEENKNRDISVLAFYKFSRLAELDILRSSLYQFCESRAIRGTILLASEGVNGTVAGSTEAIEQLIENFEGDVRLAGMERKQSLANDVPFHRLKVKIKKEIVTMGEPAVDVISKTGIRVKAEQWNKLLEDEDVIVLDTRNQYEVDIGTFKNAVSPHTETFREFPDYVENQLAGKKKTKIAMFCTGGIRCEKASSYLLDKGFDEVYQLDGGILRYLEEVNNSKSDNLWRGECFVFDSRVSVDANLAPGTFRQCFACRHPLSPEELESSKYREGVSCPNCFDSLDEKKRAAVEERQKQVRLAESRNQQHIGIKMPGNKHRPRK